MAEESLTYYEKTFVELRERLIRVLGIPTVNRLVDRAVTEIRGVHPGIASLRCDDEGVVFDGVREALAGARDDELRDTFAALSGVLLLIVARLLGREIAHRLTEGLSVAEYLQNGGLGDR